MVNGKGMSNLIIKVANNPEWLSGRQGGAEARQFIASRLTELPKNEKLVFDFSGVDVVSSSFADEVFGKLVENHGLDEFRTMTTFKDANSLVTTVIKAAIFHRNEDQFSAHTS